MREFERARRDSAGTDPTKQWYPEDFSLDEAKFASELRELFPLEEEVLPPQFVQTVIEDEWRSPVPPGFEQKLTYNVFTRLHLQRGPLFPRQPRAPWQAMRQAFTRTARPLAVSMALVAMAMIFSVIVASPSFAAGVQLLLAHTGVRQVDHYPANVQNTTTATASMTTQSVNSTTLDPAFPIWWFGYVAGKYDFAGARTLPSSGWSDGQMINLQYTLSHDSPGSGTLDIREFKIAPDLAAVLQVVQAGAATSLTIDGKPAVYVDGAWRDRAIRQQLMMDAPTWQFGTRSELMIERDGVVIWIVGDQRDGMTKDELVKLASTLTVANNRILRPNPITLHVLGENFMRVFQKPQGRELYYLVPVGAALTSDTGFMVSSGDLPY